MERRIAFYYEEYKNKMKINAIFRKYEEKLQKQRDRIFRDKTNNQMENFSIFADYVVTKMIEDDEFRDEFILFESKKIPEIISKNLATWWDTTTVCNAAKILSLNRKKNENVWEDLLIYFRKKI